jgi:hypothetical protein
MNQKIKSLWVEALKSGRYEQGYGRLAQITDLGVEYCCLGVLCQLGVEAGVVKAVEFPEDEKTVLSFDGSEGTLPPSVMEWAEIGFDPDPTVTDGVGGEGGLSEYNDSRKFNFKQIAAMIDSSL